MGIYQARVLEWVAIAFSGSNKDPVQAKVNLKKKNHIFDKRLVIRIYKELKTKKKKERKTIQFTN